MTNPRHIPDDPQPSVPQPSSPKGTPLYGPRFQNNPAQVYRDMRREHAPVAPVLLEGGVPAWCVLGYRELHQVTSNPQLFGRDPRRWHSWHLVPDNWALRPYAEYKPSAVFTEGKEHQRRGGALADALAAV